MKKILTLSLMTITIATLIASAVVVQTSAAAQPQDTRRDAFQAALGAELVVPGMLPAEITDPILMEAWIRLYNEQDAVTVWNGKPLTGRDLAQFVLEQGIPVVFDTENICLGGSCSKRFCVKGQDICDYEDGQPGIDPIYIAPTAQPFGIGMQNLVSTLAHEIYHRTAPFGDVHDSLYEEYWAYFVGEKVSGATVIEFGAYDPLQAAHLTLWIKENRLDAYLGKPAYPAVVAAVLDAEAAAQAAAASAILADTNTNTNGIPAEFFGASQ
jgi:hypothetical protein